MADAPRALAALTALLVALAGAAPALAAAPKATPTAAAPDGAPASPDRKPTGRKDLPSPAAAVDAPSPGPKSGKGKKRPLPLPDDPEPGPDGDDAGAAPPTADPVSPPDAPLPLEPPDRQALAALCKTLPRHGLPPQKPPARDADDAAWRAYARRLVDAFAPRSLRGSARERLVAAERPLAPAVALLVPRHRRYVALQRALLDAARLAMTPPPVIPKRHYEVRVGVTAPEVALLRERLLLEGFGDPNVVGRLREYFDPRLKHALWAWQKARGLPRTTVLDPLTRKHLAQPLPDRVPQVALALARWRELDLREDRGRHVLVHLNAFALAAEEDGRPGVQMPVIVGRATAADATPGLSAPMTAVVARPDWRVPKRIVEESLRPRSEGVPEVLADEGYDVDVATSGEWKVRLPPGPDNPLGELKFLLRGTDGVYLHDTNRRDLFAKEQRALSHGCVRVAGPRELAAWLLADRPLALGAALDGSATVRLDLDPPVPTHLVYQTLSVGEDGGLVSHADLYGRDADALAKLDVSGVAAALAPPPTAPQGSGASSGATR